jgi:hypothetical protein
MRAGGVIVCIVAIAIVGYGWFALAWDGGTPRTRDDWLLIALGALLLVSGGLMVAGSAWGLKLAIAVGVILGVVAVFARLNQAGIDPTSAKLALHELPLRGDEREIAAAFGDRWWATSVEELRTLRRQNDAIARDWQLQGDQRVRLVVMMDTQLPVEGERMPLNAFLLLNAGGKRTAREVVHGFYSDGREAPFELTLQAGAATIVAKSERERVVKSYTIDPRSGEIRP